MTLAGVKGTQKSLFPEKSHRMAMQQRKPISVPAAKEGESAIVAIAKDWLAGGTAAGISKTLVAPIGAARSFKMGVVRLAEY
jgi:hypothetical protein